jgi:hypothetical protein
MSKKLATRRLGYTYGLNSIERPSFVSRVHGSSLTISTLDGTSRQLKGASGIMHITSIQALAFGHILQAFPQR